MKRIYLDYAATTPVHPEVVKTTLPYFTEAFGNPSSIYSYGQEAKEAIEEARGKLARLIGARNEEIVFTSGGTEADNFALEGIAFSNKLKGTHIITTTPTASIYNLLHCSCNSPTVTSTITRISFWSMSI